MGIEREDSVVSRNIILARGFPEMPDLEIIRCP